MLLNQRIPHHDLARIHPVTCAILVAPCDYQPRVQWSVAHELAEAYTSDRIEPEWHEAYCDRLAAGLLMPRAAFAPSALSLNLRLPAMHRLWPHCSLQALATRVSDLFPGTQASVWHNGLATSRRSFEGLRLSTAAEALEEFVAAEACYSQTESYVHEDRIATRAWPTGEGRSLALSVVV